MRGEDPVATSVSWLMRLFSAALVISLLVGCEVRGKPAAPDEEPIKKRVEATSVFGIKLKSKRCYAGAGTERWRPWVLSRADYSLKGRQRVKLATTNKLAVVKKLVADAGLTWPPKRVFLRAFKKEKALEVWASNSKKGAMTHLATYGICYASGAAGPKRREGDGQVPEGFYKLNYYNRNSSYFLSMRINYPNRRDRKLKHTGSAIMIHGHCVSIGCLAMSDDRIQELWLLTRVAHRQGHPVRVHLFPSCDMRGVIADAKLPRLKSFWRTLKRGYDLFEKDRVVPAIGVDRKGNYTFPE